MKECNHKDFEAKVSVKRIEDVGAFIAELVVSCKECGVPFRFIGCSAGTSYEKPTVSIDGLELHAAIEPEIEKKFAIEAVFQVLPQQKKTLN